MNKVVHMSLQLVLLSAILKLLSPRRIFKYFRSRYSQTQIDILNHALKSRFHYRSVAFNVVFLRRCLDNGVCPGGVENRVRRTKAYHTLFHCPFSSYMYFSLPFRLFLASSPSLTL